jgi:trehalose utilization protein
MTNRHSRRAFVKASALTIAAGGLPGAGASHNKTIRVVVWDEQQPEQKQAYPNFLGNEVAAHLETQPGFAVKSVRLDDPDQGLADGLLDACDVLIWWGHVRNREIKPETGQMIVQKIKGGKLSLIALHSAHWSTPFVEAMYERTRSNAAKTIATVAKGSEQVEVDFAAPKERYTVPKADDALTPRITWRKFPDYRVQATVRLPYCCFPAYRNDGKPSRLRVLRPNHPIVAGIPSEFELPHTEMYAEPFHVPEPDEVILEERWATGEWFRSGAIWKIGQGHVFYFRPGHEIYATYKQPIPLAIITNAVRYLSGG